MRLDSIRRLWQRFSGSEVAAPVEPARCKISGANGGGTGLRFLRDPRSAAEDAVCLRCVPLETALDHLPVPAIALDEAGRPLAANAAANSLFGGAPVPQAVLEAAERAVDGDEPQKVKIGNDRVLRVVVGSSGSLKGAGLPRLASGILFLVPADGSFELDTRDLQTRYGLTPTQCRVVSLTAQGLTNKEIASRLSISHETVHKHLMSAFHRTGAPSRAGLVALAFGSRFGIDV